MDTMWLVVVYWLSLTVLSEGTLLPNISSVDGIIAKAGHIQAPTMPPSTDREHGRCIPARERNVILHTPVDCRDMVLESLEKKHPDQFRTTPEIIKAFNYAYEIHKVVTEDGYVLTVFRIVSSPKFNDTGEIFKPPVFLVHGMGASSVTWFFQNHNSLPFVLADAGFDVWLGNNRGTTYSLGHEKYNAKKDIEYWNFSFHEMGLYDLPATFKRILQQTQATELFYIGHSQGTTQYFVALSEFPELNSQVKAGIMLAPIGHIGHMTGPMRKLVPLLRTNSEFKVMNEMFQGRIQSGEEFRRKFKRSQGELCESAATRCGLCDNIMFSLFGYNAMQMNLTEIPNMMSKYPDSISIKQFAHYAQLAATCRFQTYDDREDPNDKTFIDDLIDTMKRQAAHPPRPYNLTKITAPTYFIYGKSDMFGPPIDAKITASQLPRTTLKKYYSVKQKYFTHADFIVAKDARTLVYNEIVRDLVHVVSIGKNQTKKES